MKKSKEQNNKNQNNNKNKEKNSKEDVKKTSKDISKDKKSNQKEGKQKNKKDKKDQYKKMEDPDEKKVQTENESDNEKNNLKETSKNKKEKKTDSSKKNSKIKNDSKDDSKKKEQESTEKEHVKLIKFEEIKNIFKKKKAVPKENLKKINQPVFQNILMAIIVIVYFIFLILGFNNIENSIYQTDLKVFSFFTLLKAIVLLEKAYKNNNGKLAMFGVETIFIAIITLALIYINIMLSDRYVGIVLSISYILAIYYVIKSIILYIRGRKKYFVDDMKEIMKTDE